MNTEANFVPTTVAPFVSAVLNTRSAVLFAVALLLFIIEIEGRPALVREVLVSLDERVRSCAAVVVPMPTWVPSYVNPVLPAKSPLALYWTVEDAPPGVPPVEANVVPSNVSPEPIRAVFTPDAPLPARSPLSVVLPVPPRFTGSVPAYVVVIAVLPEPDTAPDRVMVWLAVRQVAHAKVPEEPPMKEPRVPE